MSQQSKFVNISRKLFIINYHILFLVSSKMPNFLVILFPIEKYAGKDKFVLTGFQFEF